jgi:hypothetical protein
MFSPRYVSVPLSDISGIKSFMRFIALSNVLLPQAIEQGLTMGIETVEFSPKTP